MKSFGPILAGLVIACSCPALAAAANYESTVITGTPVNSAGFFRINVATGQVASFWGGATQFAAVPDSPALPPGEYHLQQSVWVAVDGKVAWSLYRWDAKSGRSWTLQGGGGQPFVWTEATAPK